MPPLNNSKHSTLPPESALAALFFPAGSYQEGVQKTPAERSAEEENQETEHAEEEAGRMGLEEEDWTDDDVFIPDIK